MAEAVATARESVTTYDLGRGRYLVVVRPLGPFAPLATLRSAHLRGESGPAYRQRELLTDAARAQKTQRRGDAMVYEL